MYQSVATSSNKTETTKMFGGKDSKDEFSLAASLVQPESADDPDPAVATWEKGEAQPKGCRDAWAAILFYMQFIGLAVVAGVIGIPAVKEFSDSVENNEDVTDDTFSQVDFSGLINLAAVAAVSAWVISSISLLIMSCFAKLLIQISLLFSIVMALAVAVYSFYLGSTFGGVLGIFFFLITCCYARAVWQRIPFAAANLNTGLTAIKKNFGATLVAYVLVAFSFAYVMLWTTAFAGVYDSTASCDDGVCSGSMNGFYVFLLLLALFWTQQVIQNTVHVAIAGVVATWWFDPDDASSCCSAAVRDSFVRSTTTSFGSICFGSLLVAFLQALKAMAQEARGGDDACAAFMACIAECILGCLESLLEYFNKWAFIYVGMYGYSYIDAGKNVIALFRARGWTVIINDDLVSNTLGLVNLTIGAIVGCIGLLMHEIAESWFEGLGDASLPIAFGLPFILGLVVSSVLLSVVDSAVNTVVVSFAEAPTEFQENHPELSSAMREAWCKVYPAECGF